MEGRACCLKSRCTCRDCELWQPLLSFCFLSCRFLASAQVERESICNDATEDVADSYAERRAGGGSSKGQKRGRGGGGGSDEEEHDLVDCLRRLREGAPRSMGGVGAV